MQTTATSRILRNRAMAALLHGRWSTTVAQVAPFHNYVIQHATHKLACISIKNQSVFCLQCLRSILKEPIMGTHFGVTQINLFTYRGQEELALAWS